MHLSCNSSKNLLTNFFKTMIIWSRLLTCKGQCLKVVNTPTKLKIHYVSIRDLGIPKVYLARKLTFENWFICVHHQARKFTHLNKGINNLWNNKWVQRFFHGCSNTKYVSIIFLISIIGPSFETTNIVWIIGFIQ